MDSNRTYQLDSNKKLIKPIKIEPVKQPISQLTKDKPMQGQNKPDVLTPIPKQKNKFGEKIWKKIIDAF